MDWFIQIWQKLPPEWQAILKWLFDKHLGDLIKILALLSPLLFRKKIWEWLKRRWDIQTLTRRLPDFMPQQIRLGIQNYIWPDCQNVDPTGLDEIRQSMANRDPLAAKMDEFLLKDTQFKHFILLADTGMGKTSFLLNYFARHLRRWCKSFQIELIPLGESGLAERLEKIPEPAQTVLLLDAFDEDLEAIENHVQRLKEIVRLTRKFQKIVITCRTQFFPRDEELPNDTELFKTGPRGPGETWQYFFYKLYLSPFDERQIKAYLKRRFHWWQRNCRRKAREIVAKVPNLVVRPMLLTYIDDLINTGESFHNSFQIYTAMVNGWLERELKFVPDKQALLDFSNKLAVELFFNRQKWGRERIPFKDIEPLARNFGIKLKTWQLTGRSLLNRDAEGNYKFAHRSILEFLFARQILANEAQALKLPFPKWTEPIRQFVIEGNNGKLPHLFIYFKGGSFQIGETGQKVEIKPFEMSNFLVTNIEYEKFDPAHRKKRNKYSHQDDQPVIYVSWQDAVNYCQWLSRQTDKQYSLPTEAEWEFAASGGGQRKYPWGNEPPTPERANYHDSKIGKTTPVGTYFSGMTPEGLFDMAGNVREWCQDWYDKKKMIHVLRGGSFDGVEDVLRCVNRGRYGPLVRLKGVGFRVVRRSES